MFESINALRRRTVRIGAVGALFLSAYAPLSQASLTLSSSRVVFDGDKRNVSLVIANPSDKVYAVQTWVNTEADDTTTAVPFMASPPLFRVNPGKEQQVQINGLPHTLPTDRESLFYFNAQEIPQVDNQQSNVLNIAIRTRIKFFYRPSQLKDKPQARLKDLQWSIQRRDGKPRLVLNNPTPFHYTFKQLQLMVDGQPRRIERPVMAAPLERTVYALDNLPPGPGLQVVFTTINDYGGTTAQMTVPVQSAP
ncbi:molecular chaperone [Pseudomonas sp. D1HM]|uniref:fimbrial biogenesis chaperone n=1 Tax=Pseudomonas sp. D1HM TaxID=1784816 RepID=UPI001C4EBDC2|nr:molecular chaperone [Pseudomonas sp. D1HM]MBW0235863.1 pilus assembly protein [Pseudomonas sp. D1HM]